MFQTLIILASLAAPPQAPPLKEYGSGPVVDALDVPGWVHEPSKSFPCSKGNDLCTCESNWNPKTDPDKKHKCQCDNCFRWCFPIAKVNAAPPEAPAVTNMVFVVENKVPPAPPPVKPYDPYGHESYRNFEASILNGVGRGKLAVGVPDPWVDTYENHCRVDSGALPGIADGLWECYRDTRTGKAMMVPFAPPKAMEAPAPAPANAYFIGPAKYCTKSGCYYAPAK